MKTYIIWYAPIWGQFTRYSKTIKAACIRQAEIKFYSSDAGDNCQEIITIECI